MPRQLVNVTMVLMLCVALHSYSQDVAPEPPQHIVAKATSAFNEYASGATFETILKSGKSLPSPIILARTFDPGSGAGVATSQAYPSAHIVALAGKSDFVGIGTPIKRWTYPTADLSFAVSIYLVHVSEDRLQGKDSLSANRDVYIVRAGGPFTYSGHDFRAVDPNFQLFHLNEQYLFFGAKLTNGLFKVDADRVLKLEGEGAIEVSAKHPYAMHFSKMKLQDIMDEVSEGWLRTASGRGRQ